MAVEEKGRRVIKAKGEKRDFTCVWAGVEPTDEELDQILADHWDWLYVHKVSKLPIKNPPHSLALSKLQKLDLSKANLRLINLEKASLWDSNLQRANLQRAVLRGAMLHDADLRSAELFHANFSLAQLCGANLKYADLRGADFQNADFMIVKYNRWGRYLGIRLDGCHGSPRFVRFAKDQEFIEEFRSKRWRFWLLYLPWFIFSDCGRSFLLWAAWSIAFAFLFAAIYYLGFGESAFNYTKELGWSFGTTLYYSIVTFTTLGFGDITPKSGWAAFWITLEVILGYIMLGGLISIFATKLARRS